MKTEPVSKIFSGKGMCMMHECKRLLNGEVAGTGLLFAARASDRQDVMTVSCFNVQSAEATNDEPHDDASNSDSDATGDNAHNDSSSAGFATEHATRPEDDNASAQHRIATNHADDDEQHDPKPTCPNETHDTNATKHAKDGVTNASARSITFSKTFTPRDDWLHRGNRLQDLDLHHYVRYITRMEKPRQGTVEKFQSQHGVAFLFDSHYPISKNYVQILNKQAKTVQNVGSQCLLSKEHQTNNCSPMMTNV